MQFRVAFSRTAVLGLTYPNQAGRNQPRAGLERKTKIKMKIEIKIKIKKKSTIRNETQFVRLFRP